MTNDEGCKPEGAPERSPKAGEGAPSGVDGNGPKRFSFSARWRSSRDCCAASRWIWWPGKRMSRSPGWPIGAIARLQARLPP